MGNNFKTTFTLLVVSVLVSLYAYKFERDAPDWEQKPYFSQLSSRDIVEVHLIPGPGSRGARFEGQDPSPILLRLARESGKNLPTWRITEPFSFEAFHPRVEGVVRALVELRKIGAVSPADERNFFSGESHGEILFKTRDSRSFRIEVGQEHPLDTVDLVAVRVDGEDSFHTVGKFKRDVDVSLGDLRGRALVPVPKERALRLVLRHSDERRSFALERDLGSPDWKIMPPHRGVVDRELVAHLLDQLNSWRIEDFVSDKLENPSEFGFDEPRLVISLTERRGGGAGNVFTYEVADDPGETLSEGEVFVRDPQRSFLYSAKSDIVELLERPVEELRNRYLMQLGAARIQEVQGKVHNAGEIREFRLWNENKPVTDPSPSAVKKSGEFSGWKVRDQRLEQTYKADPSETSSFVMGLSRFPIVRYLDDTDDPVVQSLRRGEVPVVIELKIVLDTTLERTFKFYKVPEGPDFPASGYLVSTGEGSEVVLLNTPVPQDISPGGIYFRDRNVSGLLSESVGEWEVMSSRGDVWNLARIGGAWRVAESSGRAIRPGKGLDETLVNSAVRGLSRDYFRLEAFLPDEKDEDKLELTSGLHRFLIRFFRYDEHQEGFLSVTVGARREHSPGQEYYGKLDSITDMPVLLSSDLVRRFIELVDHLESITEK